ncbi:MAG TPA: hypothetical protein VED37_01040, partial [Ktedonobacteraceae bacterium]|nr:hypothetical protein [Ktedonobacteraceae bacterium]
MGEILTGWLKRMVYLEGTIGLDDIAAWGQRDVPPAAVHGHAWQHGQRRIGDREAGRHAQPTGHAPAMQAAAVDALERAVVLVHVQRVLSPAGAAGAHRVARCGGVAIGAAL